MKVELTPIKAAERVQTKKGDRFTAPCLSGDDCILLIAKSPVEVPVGKPVLLDGFYLPARQPGEKHRFFAR